MATAALAAMFMKPIAHVLRVPKVFLYPIILSMCVAGSYAIRFNVFDVFVMLGAGVLGYVMRIFGVPVAPLLIAFILTTPFEESLRQALIRSEGSLMVFLNHPIALFFLVLAVAAVVFTVWRERKTGQRIAEQG